jgi:hypothetical protein
MRISLSVLRKPRFILRLLLAFSILTAVSGGLPVAAEPAAVETAAARIVVIGDPHLPGNQLAKKQQAIEQINAWQDVDLAVIVGDLCATTGTAEEIRFARSFFAPLRPPRVILTGNHDFVFKDLDETSTGLSLGSPQSRSRKLDQFMTTFDLKELQQTRVIAGYRLIFLSLDDIDGPHYAGLSPKTRQWLGWTLHEHPKQPTIIFCHSPMWGPEVLTLNPKLAHFTTQPQNELAALIKDHPQVFLWVCGHVHFGATNPAHLHPANAFLGRVNNVIACDLDGRSILNGLDLKLEYHGNLWTRSLYLWPDRVEVKTFDHVAGKWLPELDRTFPRPTE